MHRLKRELFKVELDMAKVELDTLRGPPVDYVPTYSGN